MSNSQILNAKSRRAAAAAMIGTAIEWYDFFIFGNASALVFGPLFFPGHSQFLSVLSAFAVFGIGFAARPLGGFVFGHIGDRVGRKATLVSTLLLMGIATTLVGLLPTARSIGIWAPILLVVLRLLQGFAVGGEWSGSALISVENAPEKERGKYGSFTQMGNGVGVALSTGVFALVSMLPSDEFLSWGWRLPFLASIVLVVIGMVIRFKMEETPDFKALQDANALAKQPIKEAFLHSKKSMFVVAGLKFSENVFGFMILAFVLSYAVHQVGVAKSTVLWANLISAVISIGCYCLFGILSDRFGRRATFLFSSAVVMVSAFPLFWGLQTGNSFIIVPMIVLAYNLGLGGTYGVEPAYFTELFPAKLRYSGISIATQLVSVFAGGLAPMLAAILLKFGGGNTTYVSLYIIGAGAVTFFTALAARETAPGVLQRKKKVSVYEQANYVKTNS